MIFQNVFRDHVVIYLQLLLHLHHQVMLAVLHNGL